MLTDESGHFDDGVPIFKDDGGEDIFHGHDYKEYQ